MKQINTGTSDFQDLIKSENAIERGVVSWKTPAIMIARFIVFILPN